MMKEPRIATAIDMGSETSAKARSRAKRSTYYSKVELPTLHDSNSETTAQWAIRNDDCRNSIQERQRDDPHLNSIKEPEELETSSINGSTFIRRWYEPGASPSGFDSESGSDSQISLPRSRISPPGDLENAPQWPNEASTGAEQSSAQGTNSLHSDERPGGHEAQWAGGTRAKQLQDLEALEKKVQAMRCKTASRVEFEEPTRHVAQGCPPGFSAVLSLIKIILALGFGYFLYVDITKLVTALKPLSKAGGNRYLNYIEGVIEILRDGTRRLNCSAPANYWHNITANNLLPWDFLTVAPLFLVISLIVELLGDVWVCWKYLTTPGHKRQGKKGQDNINSSERKYEPNQHHLLVTKRAVSKLVGLGGRSDITLEELVFLDQLESQGGLKPKTIQILDGIRDIVLEDVVGKLEARRTIRNEL